MEPSPQTMSAMEYSNGATRLPTEVWMTISNQLESTWDIAALGGVNRKLHAICNPLLYKVALQTGFYLRAMFWGVQYNVPQTIKNLLSVGANVNMVWSQLSYPPPKAGHLVPSFAECTRNTRSTFRANIAIYNANPFCSPIHVATLMGNTEMMELLHRHGADINAGSRRLCPCFEINTLCDPDYSSNFRWGSIPTQWTPFHIAICAGQIPAVELLLKWGARELEIEEPSMVMHGGGPSGLNAVHVATISGQHKMLQWLMDSNTPHQVDARDSRGRTPLAYAYLCRNWDCFDFLISNGADVNTPIRLCLDHMVPHNDNQGDWIEVSLLADALSPSRFKDALRLLKCGADPVYAEQFAPDDLPLIHKLCSRPWRGVSWDRDFNEELAQEMGMELLNRFLDLDLNFKQTAAHREANHDAFGPLYGHTALGWAAGSKNLQAAQRLIDAGADANGNPDEDQYTPLAFACGRRGVESMLTMVNLLIDSGADVNRLKAKTKAPLWMIPKQYEAPSLTANEEERSIVAKVLLRHGSNPGRGTHSGDQTHLTAMEMYLLLGDYDGFDHLLSHSAPGSIDDDDILGWWNVGMSYDAGARCLEHVIKNDANGVVARKEPKALPYLLNMRPIRTHLIRILLEQGANPNIPWDEFTPMGFVMQQSEWPMEPKMHIIRSLVEHGASVYEALLPAQFPFLDDEAPHTPLGVAIHTLEPSLKLAEIMLTLQPIRAFSEVDPYDYIVLACAVGNTKALPILIEETKDTLPVLQTNAHRSIHKVLDTVPWRRNTVRELIKTIDCLNILAQKGGVDLLAPAPSEIPDGRTVKEKLLSLSLRNLESPPDVRPKTRAIAWCFQNKVAFPEDGGPPIFKPDIMDNFFQMHISLEQLDRILKNGSRTWKLHYRTK